MKCEILIIGGSISGLATAFELTRKGCAPIIIDRKNEIGNPVQCAEYVPALFSTNTDTFTSAIANRVDGLETHIIDYKNNIDKDFMKQNGYILDRDRWEKTLAMEILKNGGRLFLSEPMVNMEFGTDTITVETRKRIFSCRIVVGADGPQSLTAMFARMHTQKLMPAIQWLLPTKYEIDRNYVLFKPEIVAGYGWLFPKGDMANVGLAGWGVSRKKLKNVIDYFADFIFPTPIAITGGLIPVYGVREKIVNNTGKSGVILVGDAAGFTDPITGAGIVSAFETGTLAAEVISEFLEGKIDTLDVYSQRTKFLRSALERSRKKRINMENNWNNEAEFTQIIRKNWIHS
ncbi:hypothetical protein DRQ33_01130 [bacterium]|nr:MAG: hypothetical protein DRQ33_01130 [bacterium]